MDRSRINAANGADRRESHRRFRFYVADRQTSGAVDQHLVERITRAAPQGAEPLQAARYVLGVRGDREHRVAEIRKCRVVGVDRCFQASPLPVGFETDDRRAELAIAPDLHAGQAGRVIATVVMRERADIRRKVARSRRVGGAEPPVVLT